MLKKIKNNLLHLNNLRKFLPHAAIDSAVKSQFKLEISPSPTKGKVLVLSPHPDDDVFGCGGTLRLHADQGDPIKIIYFSGSETRQEEAKKAAEIIGTADLAFLKNSDNDIYANDSDTNYLVETIKNYEPDFVYTAYFLDPHPDHEEVAKMFKNALSNSEFNGLIRFYEVWTPLYANRLITIDKGLEGKRSAIDAHTSQLKDRNYKEAFLGLNQYRAGMFNAGTYAEAFLDMKKELYFELVKIADKR